MSHLLNKWPKCRYQLFFYLFAFFLVALLIIHLHVEWKKKLILIQIAF